MGGEHLEKEGEENSFKDFYCQEEQRNEVLATEDYRVKTEDSFQSPWKCCPSPLPHPHHQE